jgi:hypothetical protein
MNKICKILGHRYWIGGSSEYPIDCLDNKLVWIWYERCVRCGNYKIQDLGGNIIRDDSREIDINKNPESVFSQKEYKGAYHK